MEERVRETKGGGSRINTLTHCNCIRWDGRRRRISQLVRLSCQSVLQLVTESESETESESLSAVALTRSVHPLSLLVNHRRQCHNIKSKQHISNGFLSSSSSSLGTRLRLRRNQLQVDPLQPPTPFALCLSAVQLKSHGLVSSPF